MACVSVVVFEKGGSTMARIVGRDEQGRFLAVTVSGEDLEERIRGHRISHWMEMFARDDEFLARVEAEIESRREDNRRYAREWRARFAKPKPPRSEKPMEFAAEYERSRDVRKMVELAGKLRIT